MRPFGWRRTAVGGFWPFEVVSLDGKSAFKSSLVVAARKKRRSRYCEVSVCESLEEEDEGCFRTWLVRLLRGCLLYSRDVKFKKGGTGDQKNYQVQRFSGQKVEGQVQMTRQIRPKKAIFGLKSVP
jgi:hypothetical protein